MTNPLNTDFSKIMAATKNSKAKTKGTRELETPMVKDAIKWLNKLPQCGAKKRQGTFANKGELDVTGCLQGRRIEMEGKIGKNKPTPLQEKKLRYWKELGAIAGVFWSVDDCARIICEEMGWDLKETLNKYPI